MAKLTIIKEPNPVLRQKASKIEKITPEIARLILDMQETMVKEKGVGLAAPQVGQSLRLITVALEDGPLALVNPVIFWKSLRKDEEEEGCLSCPDAFINVKRSKIVYIKALNQKGLPVSFRAEGFFARVLQHEIDHLNGILIIDNK